MDKIKIETVVLIWTLLFLAGMAGMLGERTVVVNQQEEIADLEAYIEARRDQEAQALQLRPPMDRYVVSSPMGVRVNPMGGNEEALHKGTDMVGPRHSEIKAAADGVVVEHWPAPDGHYLGDPVYGGKIIIHHRDGVCTLYGHMSKTEVHEGDWVEAGDVIGRQGNTGVSKGDHLHFEVIIDPELALRRVIPIDTINW